MDKVASQNKKYLKCSAAAVLLILCLLTAGCGSTYRNDHSSSVVSNGNDTNEHNGHSANMEANVTGNEIAENHSAHTGSEEIPTADVKLDWRYSPERPEPGEQTTIELYLYNKTGKPIEKYDVNHEKLMHLILVSEDMKDFMHIHPNYKGKGKFEISASFVKSGRYKLFADFIPNGSSQITVTSYIEVAGAKPVRQPLKKDRAMTRVVDGIATSLQISSVKAGRETELKFKLSDDKTKEPITDLQRYLGATGHVVILSEDMERYLHVHPKDENKSGPTAEFSTHFPEPGLYKIWGQFQRRGETFIVPFTIEIE